MIPPTQSSVHACVDDHFFMASPNKLIHTLLPIPYMKLADPIQIKSGRGDNMHGHLAKYFINNDIYIHGVKTAPLIIPVVTHILVNSFDKMSHRAIGKIGNK